LSRLFSHPLIGERTSAKNDLQPALGVEISGAARLLLCKK
jgi:hypothetical protein